MTDRWDRGVTNLCRQVVAVVARGDVADHEDDVAVGDAEPLDGAVQCERVAAVPVVEPVARRGHDHRPVARVAGRLQRRRRCAVAAPASELVRATKSSASRGDGAMPRRPRYLIRGPGYS